MTSPSYDDGLMESDGEAMDRMRDDGDDDDRSLIDRQSDVAPPAVLLVTAGYDHTIRFWDVVSGVCTSTLQYNISVSK